jgi:ectoine hydroxylase-related dioxygenase (phytanoyl-CoA dioxygenase family)
MGITHFSPDTDAEVFHQTLLSDGALIIDDLASTLPDGAAQLDVIRNEMQPYIDATPVGGDGFTGKNTRRSGALIARSPTSHALVQHPTILDVTGKLLSKAQSYQLHLTQTIAIGPGSPSQSIHRDEWAFDFFEFPSDHHVQCNTIWAMTDFTEENGATRLIPGSQADPVDLRRSIDESVPAEMTKGSCLLYTGKVYHGGGANESDDVRVGLNVTYNVGWLRQEENQYLSVPREIAETLDDDLLKLMGYRIGAYALGYIDDVRDPLQALRGDTVTASQGFTST